MDDVVLGVSDFVAVFNQTLEYAYPSVVIAGELANFRVSKNRWVYFDLKDEYSSVKFFGTVYQLPGPLEDGMLLQVRGAPRLHNLYGFSINILSMMPTGEGSIKKAQALLETKLTAEGLFDESRKRLLPYPPTSIGLITSEESAAYRDFIKILNERWGGVEIELANVQVQGEPAVGQIVRAVEYFNQQAEPPDVLVITRGGGSADDLGAFSTEQVTRAVAASRIPTLVAIGHEVDLSLAELAADKRASTPSNAAQFLVPDRKDIQAQLISSRTQLGQLLSGITVELRHTLENKSRHLTEELKQLMLYTRQQFTTKKQLLRVLNPEAVLKRGFAVVRVNGKVAKVISGLKIGKDVSLQLYDGSADATIRTIQKR